MQFWVHTIQENVFVKNIMEVPFQRLQRHKEPKYENELHVQFFKMILTTWVHP
jgi:hypothetical protein